MKHALIFLALLLPMQAQAQDVAFYDEKPAVVKKSPPVVKKKHKHKRTVKKAAPSPAKVAAAEYRVDEVKRCLAPVRVVGSQDIREDAAEASAKKAWAEHVRWMSGESFQDFSNATGYAKRCSRSSIGEALGQYFTRCEIEASPCRAGMVKEAKP